MSDDRKFSLTFDGGDCLVLIESDTGESWRVPDKVKKIASDRHGVPTGAYDSTDEVDRAAVATGFGRDAVAFIIDSGRRGLAAGRRAAEIRAIEAEIRASRARSRAIEAEIAAIEAAMVEERDWDQIEADGGLGATRSPRPRA